jgi:lysophospholipase L1-like esterase
VRQTLGKLALVAASVLVPILLVDLVLLALHGPVRVVEEFYEPVAGYGYRMRPQLEFEFANPYNGFRGTVHTNALGLRGADVAVPKPPGLFRILFVGDSMTAGLEVDDGETFAAVCGRALGETMGAGRRVESINAGVRGYNLDNVLGYVQDAGMRLQPDVVVYTFTDNDLTASSDYAPEASDWSRGSTLAGVWGRVSAYSHLTYRLQLLRQQRALRAVTDTTAAAQRLYVPRGLFTLFTLTEYETDPSAVLTALRVAAIDSTCRAHGARLVLAGAPHRLEISPAAQDWLREFLGDRAKPDFDGVRRYLDWVAAGLGCVRVDPVAEFRAEVNRGRDFWFHKDDHLNARGHRLFGEILARALAPLAGAAPPP